MIYFISGLIIIFINVIPAFMPPTWSIISFIYIRYETNLLLLTLIGVISSSIGRLILARFSKASVPLIFSSYVIGNMNFLGKKVLSSKLRNFIISLIWALSPIGSNVLFIAAGLSKIGLKQVLAGFILGRAVSYFTLAYTSNLVVESLKETYIDGTLSSKQIIFQIIGVLFLAFYIALDWEELFLRRKLRFNFSIFRFRKHAK